MSDPIGKVTKMAEQLQETQPESSTAELFSAIANALKHLSSDLDRIVSTANASDAQNRRDTKALAEKIDALSARLGKKA
jgi:hypothetical protein